MDVRLSDLVKQFRLSGIDVSENTTDGRSEVIFRAGSQGSLVSLLATLCRFLLPLCLGLLGLGCLFVLGRFIFGVVFFVRRVVLASLGSRGKLFPSLRSSLRVGVRIPAVLEIFLVRSSSRLPVLVDAVLSRGLLGKLGRSLLLPLEALLLFGLLRGLFRLQTCSLGGLGQLFVLVLRRKIIHVSTYTHSNTTKGFDAHLLILSATPLLVFVHSLLLSLGRAGVQGCHVDSGRHHLLELPLISSLLLLLRLGHKLSFFLELLDLLLFFLLLTRLLFFLALDIFRGHAFFFFDFCLLLGDQSILFLLPASQLFLLLLDGSQMRGDLLLLATCLGR